MSDVKPIPEGFNTVSAYLIVANAAEAMAFYAEAFAARPGVRMTIPGTDATMHAEMRIGDSTVMLTDENPQWGATAPATLGGTASSLHLYVEDADAAFARAVEAGCEVLSPIEDTFWGDRYAKVRDPFGHTWGLATHREDLSAEELQERAAAWFAAMADGGSEG